MRIVPRNLVNSLKVPESNCRPCSVVIVAISVIECKCLTMKNGTVNDHAMILKAPFLVTR